MSINVFDHPWLNGLFADEETAEIWSSEAQLEHMLAFEAAWSRALSATGLADSAASETAAKFIETAEIDIAALRAGTGQDGIPVPNLVKQLKAIAGDGIHSGSTSQDVIDTALALTLKATSALLDNRLGALASGLSALEDRFGDRPLMGRTRMQAATEITVRDRVMAWRLPIEGYRSRLPALRQCVERVQVGGASGNRAAVGDKGQAMADHVAASLGLSSTGKAWHAMRENLAAYAGFLSEVSGTLGKMGTDICLMAQQGIDEIALKGGGGSSAMPHKQNPVVAELLVTLGRFNAVQLSGMHQALLHEQERSGAAWALEWMILPQMAMATGRATSAALTLIGDIERIGNSE
ncbi:3-carboxy-cis,cis-muconate cycloisomerase [Fulvimarina sp. MAC8]|uniref:3-carboxy-cis,cis-muconate cycloisomerase n=1 Tax=Fulvimarina sp. MAC8 TaxID=3162874 RepID=UPI0032EE048D